MQSVINLLGDKVRVTVECAYPTEFLNLCAAHAIGLWDVSRRDEVTLDVSMTARAYRRLRPLLEGHHMEVHAVHRRGAPILLRQIRKRYVFLIGLVLALTVTWVMSLYILEIQVEGNELVPQAVILSAMADVGVEIGAFGLGINPEIIRHEVLLQLEDVAWITVNRNGSRATVIVRERIHPPDRIPEEEKTAVYATRGGIIDEMVIWEGVPLIELGDTVEMGQDLITGRVETLAYGTVFVRADARIYARTWYTLSMSMPLERFEKVYTGEVSTKSRIFFGESRINLYFDSGISYRTYDKIVETSDFVLPGGIVLPIRRERRVYTAYDPVVTRLDETTAALYLQERLLERLEELIGPTGQVLSTRFEVEIGDGVVTVQLRAECREQIAALRRLREEEMVVTPPLTEERH